MEKINWLDFCAPCKSRCCYNENPFASEYELKKLQVSKITTKEDGSCIFLDESKICKMYEHRPFECRIFPFDIQEIDGSLFWVIWTNCPAEGKVNHEDMILFSKKNFQINGILIILKIMLLIIRSTNQKNIQKKNLKYLEK